MRELTSDSTKVGKVGTPNRSCLGSPRECTRILLCVQDRKPVVSLRSDLSQCTVTSPVCHRYSLLRLTRNILRLRKQKYPLYLLLDIGTFNDSRHSLILLSLMSSYLGPPSPISTSPLPPYSLLSSLYLVLS